MLRFVVFLMLLSGALAAVHDVCHANAFNKTEVEVVELFAQCSDRNKDGIIREAEVVVCFSDILDTTLPFPRWIFLLFKYETLVKVANRFNFNVDRDEFIEGWTNRFHDSPEFTGAVFDAFDTNNDTEWTIMELDNLLRILLDNYDDGDGKLSKEEFMAGFLQEAYFSCLDNQ